jgi:uncharacterized protein
LPLGDKTPDQLLVALRDPSKGDVTLFKSLLVYGGFPEPFLTQSQKVARIWRKDRVERLVREDLRDLSRLPELGRIEITTALLPERMGLTLSIQSLREDLGVSYDTVKRWLGYVDALYYHFEIKPWHKNIPRALKKEVKLYLWDWSEVPSDGARFENMIAAHLLKACHFWTDSGEGVFELCYFRDKEKLEIDFLIVRDRQPWLPVACKLSDKEPSTHIASFLKHIAVPFWLQVVADENIYRPMAIQETPGAVISASSFLAYLP